MNWPDDFINKIICGDCLEVMKEMPNESIDMVITSPPYWGLRDYGTGPDQLGLEPTPEVYIEHLTEIFNEVKRVLKREGTLWLNMGDTYNAGRSGGWAGGKEGFSRPDIAPNQSGVNVGDLQPKCLCMIPERLAWSLIQNGWILRNKIIWYKPNAMPSSVTDRFSNRWEYLYMFSKSQRYYFDLDAVREPCSEVSINRAEYENRRVEQGKGISKIGHKSDHYGMPARFVKLDPLGKNPGDVFEINTQPFPEAHFAVFPEKLCEKPIKAGCPEEVCKKCGKARERIVEEKRGEAVSSMSITKERGNPRKGGDIYHPIIESKTIGWTSCSCGVDFEGGIVLDPFCGAGTALYMAKEMKRRYIGIDIKEKYCEMARRRLAQGVL